MLPEEVIAKALSRLKADKLDLENAKGWEPLDRFAEKYEDLIPLLVDVLNEGLKTAKHFRQNTGLAHKHLKMELLMSLAILGVKKVEDK